MNEQIPPALITGNFFANQHPAPPTTFVTVGKLVHWERSPSFYAVAVLLDSNHQVRPGQFLAVWHGRRSNDILTVIQVGDCHEVNPNEDPELAAARERLGLADSYAPEGVSTRIFRLAACETIEELEVEERAGEWRVIAARAPEALSRSGDPVVLLPQRLAQETVGCLTDPESSLSVGSAFGVDGFPVNLRPEVLQMHAGVFGNPGKGKSYLSGVLLEEARRWNIPIIAVDINGEFAETARSMGGLVITLPDPARFGLSLRLLTSRELVSVTPNVQPNTQYGELIEIAHDQLRNDREKHGGEITFDDLIAKIELLADNLKATAVTKNSATNRVRALSKDPLIRASGSAFDFVDAIKKHGLVVLDCRYLSIRATQLIAAAAARTLQKEGQKMARLAESEPTNVDAQKWLSLLFIDEAHAVAPDDAAVVSTQVLYELARMGRHARTGLLLSSQSPADLDRSILKRLQTRFVFALERDQLAAIGGVSADLSEDLMGQLPKLPRGVCAVSGSSEIIKHGFLLQVRARETPVGGRTPPVFSHRTKSARN